MEKDTEIPVPDNKSIDANEPIKPVKVRLDLQTYFEVVSHRDKTLKCKLAGIDGCKMDGEAGSFKFCANRGWYNFERHVIRAHKVSKDIFLKASSSSPSEGDRKKRKTEICYKKKKKVEMKPKIGKSNHGEIKWKNLLSKDQHCLVCLHVCHVDSAEDDHFHDQLKSVFPGCYGSNELSEQLLAVFFLRIITDFPAYKCEEFLKQCRGKRMPSTWFSLCSACREVIVQAASLHNQLICLQNKLHKLKELTKLKLQKSVSDNVPPVPLGMIEEEIREYMLESVLNEQLSNVQCELQSQRSYHEDASLEFFNDGWTTPKIVKIENRKREEQTQKDDVAHPKRQRKNSQKSNYKEEEHTNVQDSNPSVEYQNTLGSEGVIIKVEQELTNECEGSGAGKIDEETTNQDDDENPTSPIENDNDYDVAPSELELESEDSEFSLHQSSKSRLTSSKSKIKGRKRTANSYTKKSEVDQGDEVKESNELYVCEICPAKYKTSKSLRDHLGLHEVSKTQGNIYDCQQCGYPCHSEKYKIHHIRLKHGCEEDVPCTLCNHISPSQKLHNRHLQEHKEEAERERVDDKYFCKLCNRLFVSFDVLCKHKRTTHYQEIGVVPFRCEHCSLILGSKRLLRDHIQQTHRKQSRYFCEVCGKGMLYLSKLRRHMNGHRQEKKFVCDVCGADFNYSESLKHHMKKEHPNAIGITGKEKNSSPEGHISLKQKNSCKHCNQEFASFTLLTRHIKSDHTELFSNKCDLCGKSYATPQSLRRHKDINHTKREVSCTYCGKRFLHQEYIRGHYKFCRNHPKRIQPIALTGEPLQTVCADAPNQQGSLESQHILEAELVSNVDQHEFKLGLNTLTMHTMTASNFS